ncbi:MAG: M48 family metalloprotease [Pseudobdellovibrionaceae bacterium]
MERNNLVELEIILKDMISRPSSRRTFLAAVPLLLSACQSAPQTRYREGSNEGQDIALTPADEKKMTAEVLPQMKKDYPAIQNPELQSYLSNLGHKITRANNLEDHPYNYSFTLVSAGFVNAFALPAGTVFVTAPLVAMAETEAELAGVVGHEIGHVQARHSAERMEAAQKAQSKSWLYAVGGGLLGAAAGYGVGKLLCAKNDNACLRKAAELGGAAGVGGGLLVQKYAFMANSREDEMEADRVGFKTSVAAGYNPQYVGQFYNKLQKMEENSKGGGGGMLSKLSDAMSTHPPSKERVQQMNQMVAQAPVKGETSSTAFDRVRKLCAQIPPPEKKG